VTGARRVVDPGRPVSMQVEPAAVAGRASSRLAVVLAAPGCGWARRTGGCRFCGFGELSTGGVAVSTEDFARQAARAAEAAAAADPPPGEIDLYNSGSFLADDEVGPAARDAIFRELARLPSVRTVLVEARPEHVTREKLLALRAAAPAWTIELGIGLESASDRVRLDLMRKGYRLDEFERAARCAASCGVRLLVYALVKPPGLTEEEAREDTLATARYLARLSADVPLTMALQPAFVARGTGIEREYLAGRYQILSLWTVVEIVRAAAPLLPLHVALWDEGLSAGRLPAGCPACTDRLRAALRDFNATGDPAPLALLDCPCRRSPNQT